MGTTLATPPEQFSAPTFLLREGSLKGQGLQEPLAPLEEFL